MKVVSLFDGISCGRVALERAGLPVSRYVAFEIDQNAINCSNWNYPNIEHRGVLLKDILEDSAGFIGSGAVRGRYVLNEEGVKRVEQKLEFSQIDKSNALTTVCKDNVILIKEASKLGYTEIHKGECFDANYMGSTTRRGRRLSKKAHCVTAKNEVYFYQYLGGRCFRKFTPVEYERLQTLPDGYTEMLSDTQRYRTLGNGWNVDTIAHILNYINIDLLI